MAQIVGMDWEGRHGQYTLRASFPVWNDSIQLCFGFCYTTDHNGHAGENRFTLFLVLFLIDFFWRSAPTTASSEATFAPICQPVPGTLSNGRDIKYVCPDCGYAFGAKTPRHRHSNGEWIETDLLRRFWTQARWSVNVQPTETSSNKGVD